MDLPGSGIEAMSPALAAGFLTTEPPGKPSLDISDAQTGSRVRASRSPELRPRAPDGDGSWMERVGSRRAAVGEPLGSTAPQRLAIRFQR